LQKCVKIGFNFVRLFLNWFKLRLHCLLSQTAKWIPFCETNIHRREVSLINDSFKRLSNQKMILKSVKKVNKKKLVQTFFFLIWNMLICEKSKKIRHFLGNVWCCCESMWLFSEPKSIGFLISKSLT
jgi:hypothetical protein